MGNLMGIYGTWKGMERLVIKVAIGLSRPDGVLWRMK